MPSRAGRWTSLLCLIATAAALPLCAEAADAGKAKQKITLKRAEDRVDVLLAGKPLTAFHYEKKWDKPFLYPIRTAAGLVLSRGFPLEPRDGEHQDHAWHRGIWYGHGDINGEDFWREIPEKKTSRLVLNGEPKLSGSTLRVSLAMMAGKGPRIGTIDESYRFSSTAKNVLIESTITIHADAGTPLKFGDTDDGGFGFRLSDDFRQDHGALMTNSEGQTGTEKMWGKPAKWVDYSAKTAGSFAGMAVLDHPKNLRYPTRWHARNYSLCAANPFALASFTGDKSADGSYTVPAGASLTFRYLVILHDGEMTAEAINQQFDAFARR